MILNLLLKPPDPFAVLAIVLAIATAICSYSLPRSKRWITIIFAGLFLICTGLLFYLPTALFWETAGSHGMGKPEAIGEATRDLLYASLIMPIFALPALIGLSIALTASVFKRVLIAVTSILLFFGIETAVVRFYDTHFSIMMADDRWEQIDRLCDICKGSYFETLERAGFTFTDKEKSQQEIDIPRQVLSEIHREDFFEEHRPASMLAAFIFERSDHAIKYNSAMMTKAVYDEYYDTCVAEGKKQAEEFLKEYSR